MNSCLGFSGLISSGRSELVSRLYDTILGRLPLLSGFAGVPKLNSGDDDEMILRECFPKITQLFLVWDSADIGGRGSLAFISIWGDVGGKTASSGAWSLADFRGPRALAEDGREEVLSLAPSSLILICLARKKPKLMGNGSGEKSALAQTTALSWSEGIEKEWKNIVAEEERNTHWKVWKKEGKEKIFWNSCNNIV